MRSLLPPLTIPCPAEAKLILRFAKDDRHHGLRRNGLRNRIPKAGVKE